MERGLALMPRTTPGNFVPLDVNYPHDEAIRAAGPDAELLFVRGIAYAKRTRNGGWIPEYDLSVVAVGLKGVQKRVDALVRVRLWLVEVGGWRIRSWGSWNGQDDERSEKARRANCKRWHYDRGITDPDCEFCSSPGESPRDSPSDPNGDPQGTPQGLSKGREGKGTEDSLRSSSRNKASPGDSPTDSKPKRGSRIPANFAITSEMQAWARKNCPKLTATPGNGTAETEKFIDYWQGESGQRASKRDWAAAWRLWMRNAESRVREERPVNGHRPSTTDSRVQAGLDLARRYAEEDE